MAMQILTPALVIGCVILIAALWFGTRRSARKRKQPSSGGFAWALLFLSSGRMPPPPPQSQIEQEAGERKNRAIGRNEE
jgi:hypothetical protein